MSAIDDQDKPSDADDGRPVSAGDHAAAPGAPALDRLTHKVFRAAAIVIGSLMGVAAILINWYVEKFLS